MIPPPPLLFPTCPSGANSMMMNVIDWYEITPNNLIMWGWLNLRITAVEKGGQERKDGFGGREEGEGARREEGREGVSSSCMQDSVGVQEKPAKCVLAKTICFLSNIVARLEALFGPFLGQWGNRNCSNLALCSNWINCCQMPQTIECDQTDWVTHCHSTRHVNNIGIHWPPPTLPPRYRPSLPAWHSYQ